MANRDYDSKSHDWWTPEDVIDLVWDYHGIEEVDCDPAADDTKHIPAKCHYTKADDGLAQPWPHEGVIWVNPPYGPALQKYMRKIMAHFDKHGRNELKMMIGRKLHIWAIVPSRRFETKYYQEMLESCNWAFVMTGKPVFGINGVFDQTAKFGVMLCYWGPHHYVDFLRFARANYPQVKGTIIQAKGNTL